MDVRDRLWHAHRAGRMYVGSLAPNRATAEFGSIATTDFGVQHAWGLQLCAGSQTPSQAEVDAALQWCATRGDRSWRARVPAALRDAPVWANLQVYEELPMFAMAPERAAHAVVTSPTELRLDERPTYDDVVAAYGGWMNDIALARDLVVPVEVDADYRRFIVGFVDDEPVGCAFVWFIDGTAYISGVGVVERLRGRGYGSALTSAAIKSAAAPDDGVDVDVIWLLATESGAPVYERLGFEYVDTELQLGPAT